MKRWEYCAVFVSSDGEITFMGGPQSGDVLHGTDPIVVMNNLGDAYWELTTAFPGASSSEDAADFVHIFYFKRPIPQQGDL